MTNNNSPLIHAQNEASVHGVSAWFFIGLLLGVFGILIVYLRSPKVPVTLIADYEGDNRYLFERAYVEALKSRQIKTTWIGFLANFFLFMLFLW